MDRAARARSARRSRDFPHLKRWFDAIAARPAVLRAYELVKKINPNHGGIRTAEERAILFGQTAESVAEAAAAAALIALLKAIRAARTSGPFYL